MKSALKAAFFGPASFFKRSAAAIPKTQLSHKEDMSDLVTRIDNALKSGNSEGFIASMAQLKQQAQSDDVAARHYLDFYARINAARVQNIFPNGLLPDGEDAMDLASRLNVKPFQVQSFLNRQTTPYPEAPTIHCDL